MKASESASHAEADIHRNKVIYSITSSAVASSVGGTEMPSDLAVFILMTNSNLVG
jgi:hypothetical protein